MFKLSKDSLQTVNLINLRVNKYGVLVQWYACKTLKQLIVCQVWVLSVGEFCQVVSSVRWWVLSGDEFCQVMSSVSWWVLSGGEFCQVVSSGSWWVLAVGEFWQLVSFIKWWVLSGGEFCQVVSSVRWKVLAVLHLIEVLISWLSSRGGLMNYLACMVQIWWMPVFELKHRFRLPLFS